MSIKTFRCNAIIPKKLISNVNTNNVRYKTNKNKTEYNAHLGKTSKNHVRLVFGNATLMPDISGECKITAPT